MSDGRDSKREVLVGLLVVVALCGVFAVLGLAGGGPSFLAKMRTFDVIFRDGQGLREGCPVRVAGIDAGRVADIDLIEYEGHLRVRVRIAVPTQLAKKLKQDVKVTIQPNLTGNSRVNIVSSGRSNVPLAYDQLVMGVESTFFDPILEQVGLGPVERSHLSQTITEVHKTVETAGPRIREILTSLQETASGVRESAETVRPALEATATHVQDLAKRVAASGPKIESTLSRVESLTAHTDSLLAENRINLQATLSSLRDLTATLDDATAKNRVKVEKMIDGTEVTRQRLDRVLYRADVIAEQGVQMMTRNRASMERTISNVKDATDWADKLVQKIFANPFVLSPFYKPTPEDTRVQVVYDTAQVFTQGAQELHDLMKTYDAVLARAQTPAQQAELEAIKKNIVQVSERLSQTSQLLAEGLRRPAPVGRTRRQ
jgi:phospholipid/cholesterol/gamma-HCH transport system substrate-binding protein